MWPDVPPEAVREVGLTIRARTHGGESWTYDFPAVVMDRSADQLTVRVVPDEDPRWRWDLGDRIARPVPQRLYVHLDGGLLVPNAETGEWGRITREP